jgi:outer membrane protein assembly factor BamB
MALPSPSGLAAIGALIVTFALSACNPPRRLPNVPPGNWYGYLGGATRSAYNAETLAPSPQVAWQKGIGRGIAAPVQVHGDFVFAATTSRTLVVLDAGSGMQYWSRSFRSPLAGAPLKLGDRVYVGTGDRERKIHAIEITRGRGIWSREVGAVRVEPILVDSQIIVASDDGMVRALAIADGRVLWTARIRGAPAATPVSADGAVFVASTADTLYRVDAARGQVTARRALHGTVSAPPLVNGDQLVLPFQSGHLTAFALSSMDSLWSADVGVGMNRISPFIDSIGLFLTKILHHKSLKLISFNRNT